MAAKKTRKRVSRPKESQAVKRRSARAKPRRAFDAQNLLRYAIWAAVASALGSGLVISGAVLLAQRQVVPDLQQEIFGDDEGQVENQNAQNTNAVEEVVEPVVSPEQSTGGDSKLSDWEASEPSANAGESEITVAIQYYDSQQAFRLDFPSSWSGYEDRHVQVDWGEQGNASVVHFGFADNSDVLSVFVQSEEQWNYWKEQPDTPYASLGQSESKFFSYRALENSDLEFIQRRIAEVPQIVATFTVLQHGVEQEVTAAITASNPHYQVYETNWQEAGWQDVILEYPKDWFAVTAAGEGRQTVVFSPYEGSAEQPGITTDFIVDAYRDIGSLPGYSGEADLEAYVRSLADDAESRSVGGTAAWQIFRADVIEWREVYVPVGENVYVLRVHAGHDEMNKFDHLLDAFLTRN